MIFSLIINPAGDTREAARRVLERVRDDPTVLAVKRNGDHLLFFCDDAEQAVEERQAYEAGAMLSASLCTLTVQDAGFVADLTGWSGSQERLVPLLRWILTEFAPCKVRDGETLEDMSALARVNPDALLC